MTLLPVREMVLYKHGVGFFVRQGKTDAQTVTLTFRHDEINDVLKSLAVFDQAGGQVLGIHYQTPMDIQDRLANSSIRLSDSASLRNLLRDLRGRKATLDFETTPGSIETVTGRVIGIDEPTVTGLEGSDTTEIVMQSEAGPMKIFPLVALRTLTIHDSQSEHDLSYFLDTSMSEDSRRSVNVRLSEGEHDLAVYYVAPSPTWRVSYRVVAESDDDGETGSALLQGWGLFDNRLEEDLQDVRVTLVAGQPISFIYDLYESRIPVRPTVKDESRVAPGPVEFADMGLSFAQAEELGALAPTDEMLDFLAEPAAASAPRPARRMRKAALAQSTPPAAETKDSGEFFQYLVTTPVSVKRGESALVPIIGSEVKYQRELLYNGAKLPKHPVASLRFENVTGLTLERGPVTVVEDGDYKGEAVIPFTKDQNQVYLPYAVELGVTITEQRDHRTETVGLRIRNEYIVYEEYTIQETNYFLENTTDNPVTVTIEAPINHIFTLFDTPAPDVESATERRWKVNVPGRGRTTFTRKERLLNERQELLRKQSYQNLQQFLKNRWLDQETFDQLSAVLETIDEISQAEKKRAELFEERGGIIEQQEQFRANMQALSTTGDEATFRKRIVGQLEESQNRLDANEVEVTVLKQQIEDAEARINQIFTKLGENS